MKDQMPYGKYIGADGTETCFNRRYKPIFAVKNGIVEQAVPDKRIHFIRQEYFYDDACPPWRNKQTAVRCEALLAGSKV
jgi:hypothetical protein